MLDMIERVLLVAWKGSTASLWVEELRGAGYTVLLEDTTGERAWRAAKERGIDAVIIDGQKKPTQGRQTGNMLRDTGKTREIPIIWTNLNSKDASAVMVEVYPDISLAAPTDALGAIVALQLLVPRPPMASAPSATSDAHAAPALNPAGETAISQGTKTARKADPQPTGRSATRSGRR